MRCQGGKALGASQDYSNGLFGPDFRTSMIHFILMFLQNFRRKEDLGS